MLKRVITIVKLIKLLPCYRAVKINAIKQRINFYCCLKTIRFQNRTEERGYLVIERKDVLRLLCLFLELAQSLCVFIAICLILLIELRRKEINKPIVHILTSHYSGGKKGGEENVDKYKSKK